MLAEIIICDDIRQEILGKITIVGAYAGSMLVREFPTVLTSLTVLVRIISSKQFNEDLNISVTCEAWENQNHELTIPADKIEPTEIGDSILSCPMRFTNCIFNEPTQIVVEVKSGAKMIREIVFPVVKGKI